MTHSSSTCDPDTIKLMKRAHELRSAAIASFFRNSFRAPNGIMGKCQLKPHINHMSKSAAS